MKAESMSFFELLRWHAAEQPAAIASRSSRRTITYRRLWSRIERATARMLGEWQLRSGDLIAYWGCGHQDALTLYLAAARCGLRLLPLEDPALRHDASTFLARHPVRAILHDADLAGEVLPSATMITDLSSLIARPCRYEPEVMEDESLPSLMSVSRADDGSLQCCERSLGSLRGAGSPASSFHIHGALLDAAMLAEHVLPVLAARGTVVFR
jgi:acyl-CoA synthetase (AMP-forming)/AMP-acid ligase II